MKFRSLVVAGLAVIVLGWQDQTSATLLLSFDQSSYTIATNSVSTVQVPVYLLQTPGGVQFGPGNALLPAAITLSFNNPSGSATVASLGEIAGGPAFDSSSASLSAT